MSDALSEITVQAPTDPDAQATVTDFLDYTEYLPSDLVRSLTLIEKLDESYLNSATSIHTLTKTYGILPTILAVKRPEPQSLRTQIAHNLDRAISARESSYAEASRLYDVVDRHFNRLTSIIAKLRSLPQPPSRDPTPAPQSTSPQAQRSRGHRKGEDGTPTPRITLRLDGPRSGAAERPTGGVRKYKYRNRRVTVPGEVLPPPNPDSPPPSTDSEWESIPPSPIPMPTSRVGAPSGRRGGKPGRRREPKPPKPPRIKLPKIPRGRRPAGIMGTNVHSAVAGISSSNALALLKPPPPDAKPGSEDAPWMRLTDWEMAKLRKRMKKNAVWTPSDTMIRRELSDLGRGPENYRAAKTRAESTGEMLVDEAKIAETMPGKKVLAPGEISADALGMEEIQLSNRGMKLNEAKKLKKENMAREQAAMAAAEAEQAAQRLAEAGSAFKNIFGRPTDDVGDSVTVSATNDVEKEVVKSAKKRKRDSTPEDETEVVKAEIEIQPTIAKLSPKKRKVAPPPPVSPVSTTTSTVPLAAPGPSASSAPALPSPIETKKSTAAINKLRRASVPPKASSPEVPSSHPRSRGATANASVEPPSNRDHLRRASTASAPAPTEPLPARTRRGKRPAPGIVTANNEGGTAVSVGRRKAAPRKRTTLKDSKNGEEKVEERIEEVEEVDPDEPRYCLCGDVSFGTMICCESKDCEREWFHLECVGLSEPPGRTTKWYCPDCKKKLGIGEKGQGSLRGKKK